MAHNGDKKREIEIGKNKIVGIGNYHKTLPHNEYGEVIPKSFKEFVDETEKLEPDFGNVDEGKNPKCAKKPYDPKDLKVAALTNPQAGLSEDKLTAKPSTYRMPPAPPVLSNTTAAEMTELYWMAALRDLSFDKFESDPKVKVAVKEINETFSEVTGEQGDGSLLQKGIDIPGSADEFEQFTPKTIFRLGLPGEEVGPFMSQFFIRDVNYGAQKIDQRVRPYKTGRDYLTNFDDWLCAQNTGNGQDGLSYNKSNEGSPGYYEDCDRYISTMRDLARFVNKDALHQAYFNAALLLLSSGAKWTCGNPYIKECKAEGIKGRFYPREAGFGTLGGPHILNLVSEVATRALKIVWYQKWQTHLRLRPEAYGGLVEVQNVGVKGKKRKYNLPDWIIDTEAVKEINDNSTNKTKNYLLPMAFTAGSPTHPAYGAGHATVAGVCVTVLKAYFRTIKIDKNKKITPIPLVKSSNNPDGLFKNETPYLPQGNDRPFIPFETFETGLDFKDNRNKTSSAGMTIEGELNKLATNVSMGRSMGGVHWRTDNTRSLILGEATAAAVLANITLDLAEKPEFEFRSFSRRWNGEPKLVQIKEGNIIVDDVVIFECGMDKDTYPSAL